MNHQSTDNGMFLLLFITFLALLLWTADNLRQKYRPRPAKKLPISRRQIESIVYRKFLMWYISFCALVPLLMILLYMVGRIGLGAIFAGSLVALCLPAWNLYIFMYVQWRPLKTVPEETWNELAKNLSGQTLQRLDGAWQFHNQDWYIRVSSSECILLYAKDINFALPIRRRNYTMISPGFKRSNIRIHSQELIFTTCSKSIIRARIQQTSPIASWVKNHGGRFE